MDSEARLEQQVLMAGLEAGQSLESNSQLSIWRLDLFSEHNPGFLTRAKATSQAEAASTLLERQRHPEVVEVQVYHEGAKTSVRIKRYAVTDAMRKTHFDVSDATAEGSYGVALLAAENLKGYRFVQTIASKGGGFDYYISKTPDMNSLGEARLEVSGIFDENDVSLRKRIRAKQRQLNKGNQKVQQPSGTKFYIGIVGYKTPTVWLGEHTPAKAIG